MNSTVLLSAPIGPTIARLAAPNVAAMFVMLATSAAEAWYVGQVGTPALAGLALVFPMFMLMGMIATGAIGGAIAGALAQALGAGNQARAEAIAVHALVLALVIGLGFSVLFVRFGNTIFAALGGRGESLAQALAFSDLFFSGVVLFWLLNMLSSIVRACGHMRFSGLAMMTSSAVQIVAGGLLVLGPGPFPALGIQGAAVAILLGATAGSALLLVYLLRGKAGIALRPFSTPLSAGLFADLLKPGLTATISPLASISTVSLMTAFVARQGDAVLAGYGVGTRIEFLLIPVVFGIGAALITLVGVHFGANEHDRGHRVAWSGALAAAGITGAIGLLLALAPGLWADLFSADEAVREACRTYLRIVGPFYGFFGLGLCLFFASQGARRLFWPVAAGLLRLAVVALAGGWLVFYGAPDIADLSVVVALGFLAYGIAVAGAIKLGAWR